jgi:plastocyanin
MTDMAVYLQPSGAAAAAAAPPATGPTMSLSGSELRPATLAVVQGTTITFANTDTHNCSLSTVDVPSVLGPQDQAPGQSRTATFEVSGQYLIADQDTPHVRGAVIVVPAPYIATPDAQGNFSIEGVPDGAYSLQVYYLGKDPIYSESISVANGAQLSVKLTSLSAPKGN